MKVEEYVAFVKDEIFPKSLKTLEESKSADDIQAWRKHLVEQIMEKDLEGLPEK